jgi:hypothetical protein
MIAAMVNNASNVDKLIITLVVAAVAGIVHAISYTAAEGSLRPQRILLRRGADLLALTAVLIILRLWTAS